MRLQKNDVCPAVLTPVLLLLPCICCVDVVHLCRCCLKLLCACAAAARGSESAVLMTHAPLLPCVCCGNACAADALILVC